MSVLFWLHLNSINSFVVTTSIKQHFLFLWTCKKHGCSRSIITGKRSQSNLKFTVYLNVLLFCSVLALLTLHFLLLQSGDIHPNPGPSSVASDTSDSSFVHYNVHSIVPKLDILSSELSEFDILAFSETWLNPTITGEELFFRNLPPPPTHTHNY